MQVIGSNLEVDAYNTAHLGVELHAHTEVVYQAVVVPTQVEVIFGSGVGHAVKVVVVPSITKTYATKQIGVEHMVLFRCKGIAQVEHEVEV